MKITDLMDDYYDEGMFLPAAEHPTAARTKELTLKKLGIEKKARRRVPVRALAAAACVVVFSITAGAVGYSLWDAAREDAGLAENQDIPEWTEYHPSVPTSFDSTLEDEAKITAQPTTTGPDGTMTLISTLCSGNNVTAYLSVSPVTPEMADTTADMPVSSWLASGFPVYGTVTRSGIGNSLVEVVDYDAETETALLRAAMFHRNFDGCDQVEMRLTWISTNPEDSTEGRQFGVLTFPMTHAETLLFIPHLEVKNQFLPETAVAEEIALGADYLSVTYTFRPFKTVSDNYNQDTYFAIGDAYWGDHYEQMGLSRPTEHTRNSAENGFRESWRVTIIGLLDEAVITLQDGTMVPLAGVQETVSRNRPLDSISAIRTMEFQLPTVLDLSQVKSVTIGGQTYTPK